MSEPIKGKLEIQNAAGTVTTFTLNGETGDLAAGGGGQKGNVILKDGEGRTIAEFGQISPRTVKPKDVSFVFGGGELAGHLSVMNTLQKETIHIDGQESSVVIKNADKELIQLQLAFTSDPLFPGGQPSPELGGRLTLTNAAGQLRVTLDGSRADAYIGGVGRDGDLFVNDAGGATAIHVDGLQRAIRLFAKEGGKAADQARIHLSGEAGTITSNVKAGTAGFVLKNNSLKEIIRVESFLSELPDPNQIAVDGGGRIVVKTSKGADSILLDGNRGDIILQNADCAEDFDVLRSTDIEPATVVVIDEEGKLRPSDQPYDKKVAGVISGGGDYRPALVLDKQESQRDRLPVALLGKAYCKADAEYAPISTGDLLTTSPTPGHAMKADDPSRAFGAVIGKAMRPLRTGQGLIPILIALQ
jgi:hypothetical protein